MNFSKTGLILFLLMLLLHGCSDNPASITDDGIVVFVFDNRIEVQNHFSRSVYYFAVERELAARINWAPISRDENEIKSRQQKKILFEDISGYEKGKQVLFYYWSEKERGSKSIEGLVIDTEQ